MYFASDNTAGIAAPILEAIGRANTGYALGYGNDDWTKKVEARFAEIFEREVAVFLVPTGTAANALALAHLSPPWGAVLCHEGSLPLGDIDIPCVQGDVALPDLSAHDPVKLAGALARLQ